MKSNEIRQNPRASEDAKRFLAQHRKTLTSFCDEIKSDLPKDVLCVFLLPSIKTQSSRRKGTKQKQVNAQPTQCDVYVLCADIEAKNKGQRIKKRDQSIHSAYQKTGLDAEWLNITHVSGLWQLCIDSVVTQKDIMARMERAFLLSDSFLFLTFILALHLKNSIVKKFEAYVVCYCFSGSMVRGNYSKKSDLDVFCVINDTDVKNMTLSELKDRLRAIILGMGIELADEFSIALNVNSQVYVLTDFWEALRDGNTIIINLLRDGVPLYDKGMFSPWKQLLRTGRIRPSMEAAEKYKGAAEYALDQVKKNIRGIGEEGLYYSLINYAQAAFLLLGQTPPPPQETSKAFKERFCIPPYDFPIESLNTLEKTIRLRKTLEQGRKKRLTPADLAELYDAVIVAQKDYQKLFEAVRRNTRLRTLEDIEQYVSEALAGFAGAIQACSANEIPPSNLTSHIANMKYGGICISQVLDDISRMRRRALGIKPPSPIEIRHLRRNVGLLLNSLQVIMEIVASGVPRIVNDPSIDTQWLVSIGKERGLAFPLLKSANGQSYEILLDQKRNAVKEIREVPLHSVVMDASCYRGPNVNAHEVSLDLAGTIGQANE